MAERIFVFDDRRGVVVNNGDAIIGAGAREVSLGEAKERGLAAFNDTYYKGTLSVPEVIETVVKAVFADPYAGVASGPEETP